MRCSCLSAAQCEWEGGREGGEDNREEARWTDGRQGVSLLHHLVLFIKARQYESIRVRQNA